MAPIAMAFGVLELTGSTQDAAIVIAAPTLASIFVLLAGGVVADRVSRRKVIVVAEVTAMSAQAIMAFLFMSGTATVPLLTLFMLVNGIALAFHAPATQGFIIQLVEKEELQSTNALLGTARNLALSMGAAIGGVLVASVGAGLTLAIDALTFGLSALLIFSTKPKPQRKPEAASFFQDLALGWQEFTSHTWLWAIVIQFSLIVAAFEAVFGLLGPAVMRDQLSGALGWGVIASAFGVGTLLGGLTAIKVRPQHPMRVATILVFFFSGVSLTLSVPFAVPIVAIAAFISGFTGQIFGVLWYTTLQTKIPGEMLSRVSAYDHLGSIILAPLGIVVAGYLYEVIGARSTLLISAALVIVPTALVLCVRDVRMMRAG